MFKALILFGQQYTRRGTLRRQAGVISLGLAVWMALVCIIVLGLVHVGDPAMSRWLIFAGVGCLLFLGLIVVRFALWLEEFTRRGDLRR